jgi:hypothetical protein
MPPAQTARHSHAGGALALEFTPAKAECPRCQFPGALHGQGQPAQRPVIDPFNGQSLSREELAERLEPYRQRTNPGGEFGANGPVSVNPRRLATSLPAFCATQKKSTVRKKTGPAWWQYRTADRAAARCVGGIPRPAGSGGAGAGVRVADLKSGARG